jgi:hypothetical protein
MQTTAETGIPSPKCATCYVRFIGSAALAAVSLRPHAAIRSSGFHPSSEEIHAPNAVVAALRLLHTAGNEARRPSSFQGPKKPDLYSQG